MKYKTILLLAVLIVMFSCNQKDKKADLQSGIWLGEIEVAEGKKVPFLFEVNKVSSDSATVILLNGEERFVLNGFSLINDTLIIPIIAYDAELRGIISDNKIEGKFLKHYIENDPGIPFRATFGVLNRFEPVDNPTSLRIDGKWDVLFIGENRDTTHNVGIFKTDNNIITGSILTLSGDLRYLEGAYTEKGVQLSAFSGLTPYYFDFNFIDENSFEEFSIQQEELHALSVIKMMLLNWLTLIH